MTSAAALLFLAAAAMLFYIVRYRIHIHVSYTPRARSQRIRPAAHQVVKPERRPAAPAERNRHTEFYAQPHATDLVSALMNLGTSRPAAERAAALAMATGAGNFHELLRHAIQQAAA